MFDLFNCKNYTVEGGPLLSQTLNNRLKYVSLKGIIFLFTSINWS